MNVALAFQLNLAKVLTSVERKIKQTIKGQAKKDEINLNPI